MNSPRTFHGDLRHTVDKILVHLNPYFVGKSWARFGFNNHVLNILDTCILLAKCTEGKYLYKSKISAVAWK